MLDEAAFVPGRQVERVAEPGTFAGFRRPGGRGVGTRNFLVVLATTSDAGAFAEAVASTFVPSSSATGSSSKPPRPRVWSE